MVTPTHPPIIWSTTSQSKISSVNFYFKSTDPKNRAIQQHSDPVTSKFSNPVRNDESKSVQLSRASTRRIPLSWAPEAGPTVQRKTSSTHPPRPTTSYFNCFVDLNHFFVEEKWENETSWSRARWKTSILYTVPDWFCRFLLQVFPVYSVISRYTREIIEPLVFYKICTAKKIFFLFFLQRKQKRQTILLTIGKEENGV